MNPSLPIDISNDKTSMRIRMMKMSMGVRDKSRIVEYKAPELNKNINYKTSKSDGSLPQKRNLLEKNENFSQKLVLEKDVNLSRSYIDRNVVKNLDFNDSTVSIKNGPNSIITVDCSMADDHIFDGIGVTNINSSPSPSNRPEPVSPGTKGPVSPGQKGPISPDQERPVSSPPDLSIFKSSRSRLELKKKPYTIKTRR